MFNDLNNINKSNHQAVDDIFADTDKAAEGNSPVKPMNSDIETHRVGLDATDGVTAEPTEKQTDGRWFKIVIVVIVVAILALAGYLVYSKFMKASPDLELSPSPAPAANSQKPAAATTTGSFVTPTNGNATADNTLNSTTSIPEIPGVNAPAVSTSTVATSSEPTVSASSSPASLIDTDNDGLTDAEEKILGSNINVADTDNDGLSDYAEVKIYHTNPLVSDTDGDGYLDGAEVKSGYNPNGAGKLPGVAPAPTK